MPLPSRKGAGFTLVELIVSIAILGIMFSMVLANFRAGQKSGELDIVLKQVISGITNVRNMSLGGQTMPEPDGSFPSGGYGINFNLSEDQYTTFAAILNNSDILLPSGTTKFNGVGFAEFCGASAVEISTLPCAGAGWEPISNSLAIIFSLPNEISSRPPTNSAGDKFKYVGGVIQHDKTSQKAYFYVSLISGMVSGNILP